MNFSEAEILQCLAIFNDQRQRRSGEVLRNMVEEEEKKTTRKPQNRKTKTGGKFEKARLQSNNNSGVKTFRDSINIVRWQL